MFICVNVFVFKYKEREVEFKKSIDQLVKDNDEYNKKIEVMEKGMLYHAICVG